MSERRRNRRQNKKNKSQGIGDISRKDKILAFVAILIIFLAAMITAFLYSLSKSGLT